MCRSIGEGGRRCDGGHSATPMAQAARQQLCRARKTLTKAEAAGEQAAIERAKAKILDAQDSVATARILAGADQPDLPNAAGLRRAERTAVSDYAGGEFVSLNQFVQNGYQVTGLGTDDRDYQRHLKKTASALKRAINKSTVDTTTTAARAIKTSTAQRVYGPVGSLVGRTVTESRFTSTTKGDTPLPGFGDVTITYQLKPGTKALDIDKSGVACEQTEHELLLGPHQRFRVVSDQMVGNRRLLHMETA